jgi:hypothetical protein
MQLVFQHLTVVRHSRLAFRRHVYVRLFTCACLPTSTHQRGVARLQGSSTSNAIHGATSASYFVFSLPLAQKSGPAGLSTLITVDPHVKYRSVRPRFCRSQSTMTTIVLSGILPPLCFPTLPYTIRTAASAPFSVTPTLLVFFCVSGSSKLLHSTYSTPKIRASRLFRPANSTPIECHRGTPTLCFQRPRSESVSTEARGRSICGRIERLWDLIRASGTLYALIFRFFHFFD